MSDDKARGSSKMSPMSVEDLHKAVGSARDAYQVTRWIIKGTPPFYDFVQASLDVNQVESAGDVIQGLIGLQKPGSEVNVVVFPYGIPVIDGVLVNLEIDMSTAQAGGA